MCKIPFANSSLPPLLRREANMEQEIMNLLVFLSVIAIYGLMKVIFRLLIGDSDE
jgi:hypothetical protein